MTKPQLMMGGMEGAHNQNLPDTITRLQKGGSWKKQRVAVVLPSSDLIAAKVALAIWNLAFPPNNGVARILALGDEVGVAYSNAIESILNTPGLSEFEYLLTIEHDNCPPADGVIKLIEQMENHPELACIGGLYFTKGPGGVAQIWGDVRDPLPNFRPQMPDLNGGLVECYGTGMGFNLWRMDMFKDARIKRPWFRTLKGKDGEGVGTQDLVFWGEARKYGYRCAIDCSVKVGHYDLKGDFGIPDFCW